MNGAPPEAAGRDSRIKHLWWRSCRRHAAEITVQAANRDAFEHCIFCASTGGLPAGLFPASPYAQAAEQLLGRQHGVLLIITEAKVLNGTFGAFDFSVLLQGPAGSSTPRRLEIEVDGPQHFCKSMHGTTAEKQQAADKRKDKAAWKAGRCLLRLHYSDQRLWAGAIAAAVRRATLPSHNKLLIYTPSYNKHDRVKPLKVGRPTQTAGGRHSHSIERGRSVPWCMRGYLS